MNKYLEEAASAVVVATLLLLAFSWGVMRLDLEYGNKPDSFIEFAKTIFILLTRGW